MTTLYTIMYYLLRLAARDAPLCDDRTTAAGGDDNVAFARNGRQGHDAVESEERHSHAVQVATCKCKMFNTYYFKAILAYCTAVIFTCF